MVDPCGAINSVKGQGYVLVPSWRGQDNWIFDDAFGLVRYFLGCMNLCYNITG